MPCVAWEPWPGDHGLWRAARSDSAATTNLIGASRAAAVRPGNRLGRHGALAPRSGCGPLEGQPSGAVRAEERMDDIRRAMVIELAGANLVIRTGVLNGSRGFTMVRKGRRLISEPPPGSSDVHRCARCDDSAARCRDRGGAAHARLVTDSQSGGLSRPAAGLDRANARHHLLPVLVLDDQLPLSFSPSIALLQKCARS